MRDDKKLMFDCNMEDYHLKYILFYEASVMSQRSNNILTWSRRRLQGTQ